MAEPTLVLVHGLTGASTDFDGVVDALGAGGRRVLAIDQRGHGTAEWRTPYTFDALVGDLRAALDGLGPVDLLGHSLGGMVAMRLAVAHPELVRSLLLMDTGASPPTGLGAWFQPAIEIVRDGGMAALVAARDVSDPVHRWKLESMDPEAFVALAALLCDHEPFVDAVRGVRCPTTVIVGERDKPFRATSEELASTIAGAALEVIAGGGHSPQIDARDEWLAAVERHLSAVREREHLRG